jgi:hypothetical protein
VSNKNTSAALPFFLSASNKNTAAALPFFHQQATRIQQQLFFSLVSKQQE